MEIVGDGRRTVLLTHHSPVSPTLTDRRATPITFVPDVRYPSAAALSMWRLG
ncbi:hypothetical protein Ae168Ps1_5770c [Pseudonocardia sp. Ae168_Ps1]|nr:hypothetical protein Ae168Ps1_5770c [Pseudonocardia sp. Ae168_Ps1]